MKIYKISAIVLTVLISLAVFDHEDHPSICFYCRTYKHTGRWGLIPYAYFTKDAYSHWFLQKFRNHVHEWIPLGTYHNGARHGVGGLFCAVCPMWHISEETQQAFLTSATPAELAFFESHLRHKKPGVEDGSQSEVVNMILGKQDPPQVLCCSWTCPNVVVITNALTTDHDAVMYYFCSSNCLQQTVNNQSWSAKQPPNQTLHGIFQPADGLKQP